MSEQAIGPSPIDRAGAVHPEPMSATPVRAASEARTERIDGLLIPAVLFGLAWFVYAWLNNGREANLDYFVPLAQAFLDGRLGLVDAPPWFNEVVPVGNVSYVVYPPMPALVVLPAVAVIGPQFEQAWASILLGAANVVIVHAILRGMAVERFPRVVLSLVFAFGTIVWYSAQAGSSWHFAHVVATFFLLLSIRACQLDARTALIGLLFGAAILARLPLILAAPFFAAYLADRAIRERSGDRSVFGMLGVERPHAWRTRPPVRDLLELGLPFAGAVAIPLLLYLLYNDLRFGSPWENGYALIPGLLQEDQYRHGFFSVMNIPRKLYALFLSAPVQVGEFPWIQSRQLGGLSIVLTTPLFLWALKARRPDWFGLGAWAAVLLILIPILTHADPGGAQFGFRYAQDVYPFLFLLTVRGLGGRISVEAWIAIAIGLLINAWGMGSTYYDWWN
jgi:hypothetical protein